MNWVIGVSTGSCVELPILTVLEAVERARFDGVELGTPPRHFDPWQPSQIADVKAFLGAHRMAPVSIHAPFGGMLDLSDPNPHHRHAALGGILTAASALKELGGSILVVHATDVPRDGQQVGQRLANCLGSLTVLARTCAHLGMTLALETPLPHLVGGHPDEFAWLIERVDSIGVCFDTSHITLGRHWSRFAEVAGSRLIHVHANDHRGQFDDHLPPGDGIVDWREIAATLRHLNYRGWIMLELGCPWSSLEGHLVRARERLTALLGR
jgi:sugar phosphate isomerase/epimerase